MHIEADDPACAQSVAETARVIRANGGFVAADLVVREQGGEFSCAVLDAAGGPGRILLDYPPSLRPPVHRVVWESHAEQMIPASGTEDFTPAQRDLLASWVHLVNASQKLTRIRSTVPRFCVGDWTLRHHLAAAGYPSLREEPDDADLRDTLLGWHGMGEGRDPDGRVRWHLIPLKNLVNHHPLGAGQSPLPGRVAVVTSTVSDTTGTYENYGDLDAMQLLMHFGYVDHEAPVVHSVPVQVHVEEVGDVLVRWRGPRAPRSADQPSRPQIDVADDGVRIRHLAVRPGGRGALVLWLAQDFERCLQLPGASATSAAEAVLDAILQSNLDYYRRLDDLTMKAAGTPAETLADIAQVSLTQQHRLRAWG